MGKWCEVKCRCENREPVNPYDKYGEENYGKYKCGHDHGAYFELSPNDLFTIGYALDSAFEGKQQLFKIFAKIGKVRMYEDEYLALTDEERDSWQLEILQLQSTLYSKKYVESFPHSKFFKYFEKNPLLCVSIEKLPLKECLEETLEDGLRLIEASRTTGNPVEFYW